MTAHRYIALPFLETSEPDGLEGTIARLGRFLDAVAAVVGFVPGPLEVTFHPADIDGIWVWMLGSWGGRPLRSQLSGVQAAWLLQFQWQSDPRIRRGFIRIAERARQ